MKLKGIDILNISEVFSFLATKEVNLNTAVTIVNNIKILSVPKQVLDEKRNKIVAAVSYTHLKIRLLLQKKSLIILRPSMIIKFLAMSRKRQRLSLIHILYINPIQINKEV